MISQVILLKSYVIKRLFPCFANLKYLSQNTVKISVLKRILERKADKQRKQNKKKQLPRHFKIAYNSTIHLFIKKKTSFQF